MAFKEREASTLPDPLPQTSASFFSGPEKDISEQNETSIATQANPTPQTNACHVIPSDGSTKNG